MTKEFNCVFCGTRLNSFCKACTDNFPNRKSADEMTGDERAEELKKCFGPLSMDFSLIHERIEELVGRPVFTHEIGMNPEGLIKEARKWGNAPTTEEIISLIPKDKLIVLNTDEYQSPEEMAKAVIEKIEEKEIANEINSLLADS